jgi:hypothetical protein
MGERLNLVDRYDLVCLRDEINRDMIKQYNNEIHPIKKSLQLKKSQIDGLGEITETLGNEIDKTNDIIKKYNLSRMTIDITNNQYEIDELKFKSNFMFFYHTFLLFIILYFWNS